MSMSITKTLCSLLGDEHLTLSKFLAFIEQHSMSIDLVFVSREVPARSLPCSGIYVWEDFGDEPCMASDLQDLFLAFLEKFPIKYHNLSRFLSTWETPEEFNRWQHKLLQFKHRQQCEQSGPIKAPASATRTKARKSNSREASNDS